MRGEMIAFDPEKIHVCGLSQTKWTTLGSVAEAVSDDAVPTPYLYARMVRTLPQTLFYL